jgi:hypothetical protein
MTLCTNGTCGYAERYPQVVVFACKTGLPGHALLALSAVRCGAFFGFAEISLPWFFVRIA